MVHCRSICIIFELFLFFFMAVVDVVVEVVVVDRLSPRQSSLRWNVEEASVSGSASSHVAVTSSSSSSSASRRSVPANDGPPSEEGEGESIGSIALEAARLEWEDGRCCCCCCSCTRVGQVHSSLSNGERQPHGSVPLPVLADVQEWCAGG